MLRATGATEGKKDDNDSSEGLDEATRERRAKGRVKTGQEKKEWVNEYNENSEEGLKSGEDSENSSDSCTDDEESDGEDWLTQASGAPNTEKREEETKESFDEASHSAEAPKENNDKEPKEVPKQELPKEKTEESPTIQPKPAQDIPHGNTAETLRGVVKGFKFGS